MTNLKEIRAEKGMTLTQLAELSGVDSATLEKIEAGETVTISTMEMCHLAKALSVNLSDIFTPCKGCIL